jgi:hypothetical protein
MAADGAGPDLAEVSTIPDVFEFRRVPGPNGDLGYLRIRTFRVGDLDAYMQEVQRILALLPQDGLIIDVRGNGGGVIAAGELLLQLFTPRTIEPERLHFLNTALTLEIATRLGSSRGTTRSPRRSRPRRRSPTASRSRRVTRRSATCSASATTVRSHSSSMRSAIRPPTSSRPASRTTGSGR